MNVRECWIAAVLLATTVASGAELTFRAQEIATDLKVGYATTIVDMNNDRRPDIVVVDTHRVIWYENPTWKVHTLVQDQTKLDNVCIAPHDIDGDGQLDFALGADWKPFNTASGGTIQWLRRGKSPAERWEVRQIGEEPTTHRMRWIDVLGDSKPELVVVPLMGPNTTKPLWAEAGVRVVAFAIPADPVKDRWPMTVLNDELHVCHNFWPTDLNGDGKSEILITAFEGVFLLEPTSSGKWTKRQLGAGNQLTSPNRGASEIKLGRLGNGAPYIATIEPWHGDQVVVYTQPPAGSAGLWTRHVLDEELKWGHAVWCANLDSDPAEELVIGIRDNKDATHRCGVRVFDPTDDSGANWQRTVIDAGGVAVEDLAVADFDGDGRNDVVAVGRATHNVRIYWNGPTR